jgi:hypothetical protein
MLGGCADTSDCITVEPLAVADLQASDFRIYPNPVADIFTIRFDDAGKTGSADVRLIDIHGKTIAIQPMVQEATMAVDMRHVQPGIYIVEISDGAGVARQRIVKL